LTKPIQNFIKISIEKNHL